MERSAIGTVVERKTRYTLLVHLPREDGYRHKETPKNGPALAGYGAVTMKNALAETMSTLPEQLARSLTWDRGKEMSAHAQFKIETGIPVFFADPQSPWRRGTNETPTGFCANAFRRALTSPDGQRKRSRRSPTPSTPDPVRHSTGRPPPKHSTSKYCCSNKQMLHPLVEPGQFRSRKFVHTLSHKGLRGSMGRVGACDDNAAMESFFALLQRNVLDRQRWATRAELRLAIVTWTERTYHRRRRQRALGKLTPIEFELLRRPVATAA